MTAAFQARGVEQGRLFEQVCYSALKGEGFMVEQTGIVVEELGVEIDIAATSPAGVTYWIECKGSWTGHRPGLMRTDTIKKALLTGFLLMTADYPYPAFVILTSHLPRHGRGDAAITRALEVGAVAHVIDIFQPGALEALAHSPHN